ncbi:hypothetical protein ES703_01826 [subsurface metagenome]|nr:hypothetical protein [bacterium]
MRKALTFLMTVVVFGLLIAPFTALAWQEAQDPFPGGGYMKDTLGRYDEWKTL